MHLTRIVESSLGEVRVRFAPSPTGHLHIGGLRTAFFNYLFAKKHKGKFILRIEDTDRARYVPDAQDKIYDALKSYNLIPDEGPREGGSSGPYEQSKRLDVYKTAVHQLIESEHAYRCFCSEERLELLRKDAARRGGIPKYDRKCAHLDSKTSSQMANDGMKHVVRFKLDKQNVSFRDEIFGEITQCIDESDAVLLKSDNYPTYHLANVVDDRKMGISHVIRGMEWLSSTGKHHALYKAFDWTPPKFLHLSLIMRTATKKLSKRDKDAFVEFYGEELGVLPEAVLNLMIRNGSGIRDFDQNTFYSLEEMIERFEPTLIGRRNLLLDGDILNKYSRMAFQLADFKTVIYPKIVSHLTNYSKTKEIDIPNENYIKKVVDFLRLKEETFGNLSSLTSEFIWLFTKPKSATLLSSTYNGVDLQKVLEELQELENWSVAEIQKIANNHGLPLPKMMGIIRISLIGSKKGPPISELVEFFGVAECRDRIRFMLKLLR